MTREAEERLIAYVMLLVAGLAAVGWYAWLFTAAETALGLTLFLLGSVAVVVSSILAGPLLMLLEERLDRDWAMTARKVTLVLVLALVAATASLLVSGPETAVLVVGTAIGLFAFWAVVPLGIGAISATTGGTSMRSVVVVWPATNLLALAIFAAPTPGGGIDFGRYNVTFLDEPARTVAFLVIVAIVALGPTWFGKVIDRWVYH